MSVEIKVGQRWRDERDNIREIVAVNGDRISYTNLTIGKVIATCGSLAFNNDTLEEFITLNKEEAAILRRLLAGYHTGPDGQAVLDKLNQGVGA